MAPAMSAGVGRPVPDRLVRVLVLAMDTATPAVTAGVVELTATAVVQRSVRVAHDTRKHAELLMPGVVGACADAGVALRALAAVVVGVGPGPFTGLRVGMVTAAALGDALEVPVFGVCTLDAIATDAVWPGEALLVATDARRREVYWAAYDAEGHRTDGPHVEAPAALVERLGDPGVAAAAGGSAALTGLPVREPASPSPAGLVTVAAPALRSGTVPGPLEPLYLRRPDAVEPGPRKPVSTG
jgi:tRNA threonylcarbamoyl adenosine modification protein YeaZ